MHTTSHTSHVCSLLVVATPAVILIASLCGSASIFPGPHLWVRDPAMPAESAKTVSRSARRHNSHKHKLDKSDSIEGEDDNDAEEEDSPQQVLASGLVLRQILGIIVSIGLVLILVGTPEAKNVWNDLKYARYIMNATAN